MRRRSIARPPIAQERVTHGPDGLVRITLKRPFADGGNDSTTTSTTSTTTTTTQQSFTCCFNHAKLACPSTDALTRCATGSASACTPAGGC